MSQSWLFLTLVPNVPWTPALLMTFYPSFVQTVQSISADTTFVLIFTPVYHCLRNQMFSMKSYGDAFSTTAIASALTHTTLPLPLPAQTAIDLSAQSQSSMGRTFPILIRYFPGIAIQCPTNVLRSSMPNYRRMKRLANYLQKFPQVLELGIQLRKPPGYLQIQ